MRADFCAFRGDREIETWKLFTLCNRCRSRNGSDCSTASSANYTADEPHELIPDFVCNSQPEQLFCSAVSCNSSLYRWRDARTYSIESYCLRPSITMPRLSLYIAQYLRQFSFSQCESSLIFSFFEFGNAHTFNVHVGLRVWISNESLRWLKGLFHCSMGAHFPFFVCVDEIRDVIAAASSSSTRKPKTQNYTSRHYWHANNPAIIAKSSPLASKAERHSRSSLIYCVELMGCVYGKIQLDFWPGEIFKCVVDSEPRRPQLQGR